MDSSKKYENQSPETKTNFLSKMFFCWVIPFLRYGYRKDLEVKDIYNTVKPDQSGQLGDQLEKMWLEEIKNAKRNNTKPSLKKAIFKTFYKTYMLFGIMALLQSIILSSIQPTFLANYVKYFSSNQENFKFGSLVLNKETAGWFFGLGVVIFAFFNIWLFHFCMFNSQRIGMRVRIASCSLIYRKLLRISQASLGQTTAGKLVNILSNDVQRFDNAAFYFHFIWIMPIQFVIASFIMYRSVGLATIAAMITVICQALFIQGYFSRIQGRLRSKIAQKTDYRVRLMNEIVSGIQVIKMYAWEKPFEKVVELARRLEIKYVSKSSYIRGFSLALMVFTERFILYLILIVSVILGNQLTSDVVFSMAQLINTIQLYMCRLFPYALINYAEVNVTIKRLEHFLLLEEKLEFLENEEAKKSGDNGTVKLQNVNSSWLANPVVNTLININLTLEPGTLCCIVGNVGSGKSSLLQLLLKEMPLKSGKLYIDGTVAYTSQAPWLFVSSVRNNILFGRPFITDKYDEIVHICALEKDFEQFPHGDKTLVGERGISLSGGQRARINLARAVYTDADIYLFDDPLSAVDTHVAKHLFEKCIKNYLNGKTRILATHQLQFLKDADIIVVINNGQIENIGTYKQLHETVEKNIKEVTEEGRAEKKEIITEEADVEGSAVLREETIEKDGDEPQETEELIERGTLPGSLYWEYYKTGTNPLLLIFVALLFVLAQMASNACDLWVTHWTNEEELRRSELLKPSFQHSYRKALNNTVNNVSTLLAGDTNFTTSPVTNASSETTSLNTFLPKVSYPDSEYLSFQVLYMIIYTVFILSCICLVSSRAILYFKICMNASRGLHNKMFSCVLKAPMRFFDTNPSGRILNRFSKDIGVIDEILPTLSLEACQIFLVMIGIVSMVFIVTPWMIFPTAILGAIFYYFRIVYLSTAQDVKRIEGVTRAPVFSHVTASLNGLSTIRSLRAQKLVAKEFDDLQDTHTGSWYLFIACSETFGFYLDVISTLFLAMVTLQFLVFRNANGMSGDVGLVISSSLILTGMLQLGVRQTADVASNMTSVERVLQYTKLDIEEDLNTLAIKVPDRDWPYAGKISFKNVYVKYAPDQSPVLRNLNIEVKAGDKVGIVGRTGAGKSSLISSVFRLAPIEGIIAIDEIDTATIQLDYLRSHISIIPQEPVLFSASIRHNLDPFEKVTDEVIWKALTNVELKGTITDLEQMVSEGGTNFSVGQRQLICLARAIVRNNKILVMDEATANVDPNTDSLIQRTIRENFEDCTVLTIAHRLNTIMDSDKVLVMENGEVVEFAHPHELLQKPDGHFTKMVNETGSSTAEHLKSVARKAYELGKNI